MSWILKKWRHRRRAAREFLEGFTPMTQFMPEDIFIVGYPKSGNTWFQDLIAAVAYGVSPAFAPSTLVLDLVPDLHRKSRYYRRHGTPTYFKSHHFPRPDHRRVVYLMRDGRDVMVSYYHYMMAITGHADFMEMVQRSKTGDYALVGKWHEHVNSWLANPFNAQMMVIKYENLKRDTAAELARFCAFAGLERDHTFLEAVAREAVFEKMQQKEARLGQDDPGWPKDKLFRRRGEIGSYKDEMPADVLRAFMAEAGETLRQCGYLSPPAREQSKLKPTLAASF